MKIILSEIQWPMISALAASIGVIIALVFYILNLKHTRISNSAKMVLDLVNSFNSADMRKRRGRFAKALLDKKTSVDLRRDAPVLEFFEVVGYMTQQGVIDKKMVWRSFFWWLEFYYLAVTNDPNLIEEARSKTKSSSFFSNTIWLYKEMCEIDIEEEGTRKHICPSKDDVREFLEDESRLDEVALKAALKKNSMPPST
jgi:hypothetical protein